MSRDTTLQSDIGKANAITKEGVFKRADSAFRNHVAKDTEFLPEKGESWTFIMEFVTKFNREIPPLRVLRMPCVRVYL